MKLQDRLPTTMRVSAPARNTNSTKQQQTVEILMVLRESKYIEGKYEKPFRTFYKEGSPDCKLCIQSGTFLYGSKEFPGLAYQHVPSFLEEREKANKPLGN